MTGDEACLHEPKVCTSRVSCKGILLILSKDIKKKSECYIKGLFTPDEQSVDVEYEPRIC